MKYLISIQYDGSKFYGFQRLKNKETVQQTLENALTLINKKEVLVKGAGRTDRGVHALDQKASFSLDINIAPDNLKKALNSLVKPYIYITDVKIVDNDFHARFNTLKKEYVYKINMGEFNPLENDYIYQHNQKLNLNILEECARVLIGEHNYKNFVSGTRGNYDCTIYDITFSIHDAILEIKLTGKSFYRYMVRNLVGAMLDIEKGKFSIEDLKKSLSHPNEPINFTTISPTGLYLNKIYYQEGF